MLKISTKKIKTAQSYLNLISLANENIKLELLDIGATVYSLQTKDRNGDFEDIVLQYADIENYIKNPSYYGASIGRIAGRIKNGEFSLNDKTYNVPKNENDINTLHGGLNNIAYQRFDFEIKNNIIKFSHIQKSVDDGFPADVKISISYELLENSIIIHFEAVADEDTILNLTNHNYYNLSGNFKSSIDSHKLIAPADRVVVTDENNIPNEVIKVPSEMDFNKEVTISEKLNTGYKHLSGGGIDHCYVVNGDIVLKDENSGRQLKITSSYPAVQIYTTNFPDGLELSNGKESQKFDAICFEPQFIPSLDGRYDSNQAYLKKGVKYQQFIKLEEPFHLIV